MDVNSDTVAIPQLNAMAYHSLLRCERGELGRAEAAARRAIATAAAAGRGTAAQVVGAYLTMVQVNVDRGAADEADVWRGRIAPGRPRSYVQGHPPAASGVGCPHPANRKVQRAFRKITRKAL